MRVFDFFIFNDEIEMLELRLNILSPYVDYFVITEGANDFHTRKKPFHFEKNRKRFEKFKHKIIYLKLQHFNFKCPWRNETYSRNIGPFMIKESISYDDVLMYSDVDEFPNPACILNYKDDNIYVMSQQYHYFKFNLVEKYDKPWLGTTIMRAKSLELPDVKKKDHLGFYAIDDLSFQKIRNQRKTLPQLKNGGWHFSYCLPMKTLINKIKTFSHAQDLNIAQINNEIYIQSCINKKESINCRGEKGDGTLLKTIEPNYDNLPKYLIDNLDKYKHLL